MNIETIKIVITGKGEVQIHVEGVNGPACMTLTGPLEQALGGQLIIRDLHSEFYDETSAAERINTQA